MAKKIFTLLSASDAEEMLGEKYFYRQRIYRLAERGRINEFTLNGKTCFLGNLIVKEFLKDLELRIQQNHPNLDFDEIHCFYDEMNGKRMVVDGLFGKGVSVDTDKETEEDLLKKVSAVVEWFESEQSNSKPVVSNASQSHEVNDEYITSTVPEEIEWIRVDTHLIEEVEVKSYILISLPSIAQYVGMRSDHLSKWIEGTDFEKSILSIHHRQIHDPQIKVPWKKGFVKGYIPLLPFELLPELLVSFRQSGRSVDFPEKAELLYSLASSVLRAVGLAVSGNRDKAAEELAAVSRGLGIDAANQVIAIFKTYESRDYQVQTNKEFNSKVKEVEGDRFALITHKLTLGITNKKASEWQMLGKKQGLPSKIYRSGREVMRTLSPSDSIGMTFGEKDYIKNEEVESAIETGKQGKSFYERLKNVGLLEEDTSES